MEDIPYESTFLIQGSPQQRVLHLVIVTLFVLCLLVWSLLSGVQYLIRDGVEVQQACMEAKAK